METELHTSAAAIDYSRHPELYRTTAVSEDVLNAEPYASEMLPYLQFRTPRASKHGAQSLYNLFMHYREQSDFVGMDMARKFLEMGWLRTRRYASNALIRGIAAERGRLPQRRDLEMADASRAFYGLWQRSRNDPTYVVLKGKHRRLYEQR